MNRRRNRSRDGRDGQGTRDWRRGFDGRGRRHNCTRRWRLCGGGLCTGSFIAMSVAMVAILQWRGDVSRGGSRRWRRGDVSCGGLRTGFSCSIIQILVVFGRVGWQGSSGGLLITVCGGLLIAPWHGVAMSMSMITMMQWHRLCGGLLITVLIAPWHGVAMSMSMMSVA